MLENEIKVIKNEIMRLNHEHQAQKEKIKENTEKIKLNKQLPYLVANVVEMLDMELEEEPEEDGANIDLDAHRKGTCCVLKTSTRQTIFLPVPGLVATEEMKPADLVGSFCETSPRFGPGPAVTVESISSTQHDTK